MVEPAQVTAVRASSMFLLGTLRQTISARALRWFPNLQTTTFVLAVRMT